MSEKLEKLKEYSNLETGNFTRNDLKRLEALLKSVTRSDLITKKDHKDYIEILQKFRKETAEYLDFQGNGFRETIRSFLSVGEDGLYSNEKRFLYELIQNVDDCEYNDISECNLDIKFDWQADADGVGRIIYTYNEKGFEPINVFAITGIAEKIKNISENKIEIGEKGIGFKSVFGVANKVRIESGMFSFELKKDNITIPISKYDDYEYVKGTRLTLFLQSSQCETLYRDIVDEYKKDDAILKKNPIIFLNKLTHLKIYFDEFRYIEFNVERKEPKLRNGIKVEENVVCSVDIKDSYNLQDYEKNKEIECYRYTYPLVYGRKECLSRYGENCNFINRNHNLVLMFPKLNYDNKISCGVMYSFLPTQIKFSVPIIMHIPYKLDASREYVDPQDNNSWFEYTNYNLKKFLKRAYIDFSRIVKENILLYIPKGSFFKNDSEKTNCLISANIDNKMICVEKIFLTIDNMFENIDNIISFRKTDNIYNKKQIYRLLDEKKSLFIPKINKDVSKYGISVIDNPLEKLFIRSITKKEISKDGFKYLSIEKNDINYTRILEKLGTIRLTESIINAIALNKKISNIFYNESIKIIENKNFDFIKLNARLMEDKNWKSYKEAIEEASFTDEFKEYLNKTQCKFYRINSNNEKFILATNEGIIFSGKNALGSAARFIEKFDKYNTLVSSLRIRAASEKLNKLEYDKRISNEEYIKQLAAVRRSVKDSFGKVKYGNYIKFLNDMGSDKYRFLNELIQNADDCIYSTSEPPKFYLNDNGEKFIIYYNESGFSKSDVRAITAIGESTKKMLHENKTIGEKGVGFKSIFSIASKVIISSKGFNFSLDCNEPTIPKIIKAKEDSYGTKMIVSLKDKNVKNNFTENHLLELSVCLRKLKRLRIFNYDIEILDNNDKRELKLTDRVFSYKKFEHCFIVSEKSYLERKENKKNILKQQKIVIYIPLNYIKNKYPLYCGLPTKVYCNIPLVIDAPLDLESSREQIHQNEWNKEIVLNIYKRILMLMQDKIKKEGLDALKYIKINNGKCEIFTDDFMNSRYNFLDAIKNFIEFPFIGRKKYKKIGANTIMLPNFILDLQDVIFLEDYFQSDIINTLGKSNYIPILEMLGCRKVSATKIYNFLKNNMHKFMEYDRFRIGLYNYMANTQGNNNFEIIGNKALELKYIPVKTENSIEYISYAENIFYSTNQVSNNTYYILDTDIMSARLFDDIYKNVTGNYKPIKELDNAYLKNKYKENIKNLIINPSNDFNDEHIAEFLLAEYNKGKLNEMKYELKGLLEKIPVYYEDGYCRKTKKFICKKDSTLELNGMLLKRSLVSSEYMDFMRFLECDDIENINYDDLNSFYIENAKEIENDDIEDLYDEENNFKNSDQILFSLYREGKISNNQLEKYNLEYMKIVRESQITNIEEELHFEQLSLNALRKINNYVKGKKLNQYKKVSRVVWEPELKITDEKKQYLANEYTSKHNKEYSFCQMCEKVLPGRYLKRNSIEVEPKYAWEEAHINLCLNCSKDFEYFRNNEKIMNKFLKELMSVNPCISRVHEFTLHENKKIKFSPEHLALIQAIFKRQGWGKNSPKRE